MSTPDPTLYSYYDADGPLTTLSFGEIASYVRETPMPNRAAYVSADGTPFHSLGGKLYRVEIGLSRFGGAGRSATEEALRSFEDHVLRGGLFGFSADSAKTWGSILPAVPARGDTAITTAGNGFTPWSSGGAVAAGDEVVVETPIPTWRRSTHGVASVSGNVVTLSQGLPWSWQQRPLIRSRYFWPVLWCDPADGDGARFLLSDEGYAYTLRITARYSPDAAYTVMAGGVPAARKVSAGANALGAQGLRPTTASVGSRAGRTLDLAGQIGRTRWR